jgi:hypothetical protein
MTDTTSKDNGLGHGRHGKARSPVEDGAACTPVERRVRAIAALHLVADDAAEESSLNEAAAEAGENFDQLAQVPSSCLDDVALKVAALFRDVAASGVAGMDFIPPLAGILADLVLLRAGPISPAKRKPTLRLRVTGEGNG